jgi:hypothetical protein
LKSRIYIDFTDPEIEDTEYEKLLRNLYNNWDFEFAKFSLWELFICTTAVLLRLEKYRELHGLLNRTYFLNDDPSGLRIPAQSFIGFRHCSDLIEEHLPRDIHCPAGFSL